MQHGSETATKSVVHAMFDLERTYPAPVERVWKALTDLGAKEKWFAGTPGKWQLLERRMDVRVGGREILKGRWESGRISTFDAVYHNSKRTARRQPSGSPSRAHSSTVTTMPARAITVPACCSMRSAHRCRAEADCAALGYIEPRRTAMLRTNSLVAEH